jgi:hypothetical protein
MLKIGNHIIVPVEALAFVVEIVDGKLVPITSVEDITTEKLMNEVRISINVMTERQRRDLDATSRRYKKFLASKEFMEEAELAFYNEIYKDFNIDEFQKNRTSVIEGLQKGLYELTDLMLEYNIPVHSLDAGPDDEPKIQEVPNLDQIRNILDGFGKKE